MQRVADHRRVLVQLLLHEMAEIALADRRAGQPGQLHLALDLHPVHVEKPRAVAIDNRPVAVTQIRDPPCQRRQRQRIRSHEHLIVAEPHRQRRPMLSADDQLRMPGEDHRQRVRPLQPPQRRPGRLDRRHSPFQMQIDQLGHRLGIRFGAEFLALGLQLRPQLGMVFNDTIMHQRHTGGAVRMRVALGRRPVRRPPRVPDPDRSRQRLPLQRRGQIAQLALGPSPLDVAVHQGGDAGAVIAAIFQPPQRIQNDRRGGTGADNPNNATHSVLSLRNRGRPHLNRPSELLHLPPTRQRQRIRRHIFGDHAAGRDHRPITH